MTDLTRGGTHCSKCGGEEDSEGWCANYCTDDDFDFSDLSEKHLAEELVTSIRENSRKETE